jgi:hypothetical protein
MSDKKYDSVLMGYAEEPRFNAEGKIESWKVRFKDHEIKEILDSYVTAKQADGKGGNVFLTMRISKNGKPYCSVYNPSSAGAAESKARVEKKKGEEDLPF